MEKVETVVNELALTPNENPVNTDITKFPKTFV